MAQPYIVAPATGSDQADEWVRLGVEAQVAGQLPLAQQRYNQALRLDPRHAMACQNLAILFAQSNLINEAMLTIERAELMDGTYGIVKMNYALMALESERIDVALEKSQRAVEMSDEISHLMVRAMALTTAGRADEALELYDRILQREPRHPAAGPNSCFISTLTNSTPDQVQSWRRRWHAANRYDGAIPRHDNDRNPDRPLRVGYVGGDFKQHSAAFIFRNALLNHTNQIETYLYCSLPVDPAADGKTKQFQDAVGNRWRDIAVLNDEDAAALIRRDRIDILVDLAGHTNGGRLALFTRKPAPVQVTAWGFAHGTGCPEIDYFLADPVAIPEDERRHYAEKVVDLPCIVTMDPPVDYQLKGTSLPPIRKNGYFTFGVYARYEKMSDDCLRTYAEILRRVPESKLELKDHSYKRPYSMRRVIGLMEGVAPDRLLFSQATSHPDHMLAYQQADLILDVFPHSGGVVGLEQLYMGVPVLTLYGSHAAGRSTSSVLTAMGRTDWVARSKEEFVEKAVVMSEQTKLLADDRKTLRNELLNSPVVRDYHLAVEAKYREFWKEWCGR